MKNCLIALLLVASATIVVAQNKSAGPEKMAGKGHITNSGLQYWDLKVGTGSVATSGKSVTVNYTGWLVNGKKFDSSLDRNQPLTFKLDNGEVIKGWDEGIAGMKVGGKRQLRIPPDLAYGSQGFPPVIPPNATLIFDVELLGVK